MSIAWTSEEVALEPAMAAVVVLTGEGTMIAVLELSGRTIGRVGSISVETEVLMPVVPKVELLVVTVELLLAEEGP